MVEFKNNLQKNLMIKDYNKIYIIGPVGSGKTTLAKKLSLEYNISYYELDKIIWDDDLKVKRNNEDVLRLFNEILNKDSFIIEDVGRNIFKEGRRKVNIIYYIKISKIESYVRVTKRWIKQRFGIAKYSYESTLKMLIQMYKWLCKDLKEQNIILQELKKDNSNLVIINKRGILTKA